MEDLSDASSRKEQDLFELCQKAERCLRGYLRNPLASHECFREAKECATDIGHVLGQHIAMLRWRFEAIAGDDTTGNTTIKDVEQDSPPSDNKKV